MKTNPLIIVWFCVFLGATCGLLAQYESTGFTATGGAGLSTTNLHDYQALGVNPANIGTGESYNVAFGFLEGGFSVHSKALSRSNLRKMLFSNHTITIPPNLQEVLAREFVNKGFSLDVNFMAAGVAVQAFKVASIALKVDVVAHFRTRFNEFGSNFFFEGGGYDTYFDQHEVGSNGQHRWISSQPKGIYELLDGSYLKGSWTVPVTIGTGFRIRKTENAEIHLGLGYKYIFGIALLDFEAENGEIRGRGSYNETLPPSIEVVETEITPSGSWSPAGRGMGVDVGLNYQFREWFDVGLAVTDIGEMDWTKNIFSINNAVLDTTSYKGASNLRLVDAYEKISTDESVINKGADPFAVHLPAKLRLGAKFSPADFFDIGIDMIFPLNDAPGNLESPYLGAGLNVEILNRLNFSAGMNYMSDYGFSYPLGLVFGSGSSRKYEAGLASRDFLSLFTQDDPTISYNFGFLRFKF